MHPTGVFGLPSLIECKDLDLAVWVSRLDTLDELRRARNRGAGEVFTLTGRGVAVHEVEIFLLEPGTDRYLGRLCYFGRCPAEKRDCWVKDCGRERFLKQHDGFVFWPAAVYGMTTPAKCEGASISWKLKIAPRRNGSESKK